MLLRRNCLARMPHRQISQTQLPFFFPNQISNGNLVNARTHLSTFTVLYLCSAASRSGRDSPKTEEPIIDFFHSYGFTDPQIKRFIRRFPSICTTETVMPKLEYLLAFGFSPSELNKIIYYDPNILVTSLNHRIKPNLSLLEATFGSKTHVIKAVIRGPSLLRHNLETSLTPNLNILIENGISMENITLLFTRYPSVLTRRPDVLIETIGKLKQLGMKTSSMSFIYGLNSIVAMKKETWEGKMELFRNFGWSEEDTLSAFSRHPHFILLSDDKITKQMNFFIDKLQWDSAMVAKRPVVLMISLEKRVIPFCAVLGVLAKNGLWKGKPKVSTVLSMSEKKFEERFLDKYKKQVPQVVDAYLGKVDFVGFEFNDCRDEQVIG